MAGLGRTWCEGALERCSRCVSAVLTDCPPLNPPSLHPLLTVLPLQPSPPFALSPPPSLPTHMLPLPRCCLSGAWQWCCVACISFPAVFSDCVYAQHLLLCCAALFAFMLSHSDAAPFFFHTRLRSSCPRVHMISSPSASRLKTNLLVETTIG